MPSLTEVRVSYSVGVKCNIGNYESADAHLSKTETWDVSEVTEDEAHEFARARYEALHEELGDDITREYLEIHGKKPEEDEG